MGSLSDYEFYGYGIAACLFMSGVGILVAAFVLWRMRAIAQNQGFQVILKQGSEL
jgi:hypothetical protein